MQASSSRIASDIASNATQNLDKKNNQNSINSRPNQNEPTFKCDQCSQRFFKQSRYDAHMRRHMGLKAWECKHFMENGELCDKSFQKLSSLKAHIEANHYDESKGKPEYICDYDGCGKVYDRKV